MAGVFDSEIRQTLLDSPDLSTEKIQAYVIQFYKVSLGSYPKTLAPFVDATSALGLAPGYATNTGRLIRLAICLNRNSRNIPLLLDFGDGQRHPPKCLITPEEVAENKTILQDILTRARNKGTVFAFDLGPLAASLWTDHAVRLVGFDIQSAFQDSSGKDDRRPYTVIRKCIGENDDITINEKNINNVFRFKHLPPANCEQSQKSKYLDPYHQIMQSWAAMYLANYAGLEAFDNEPKVDTNAREDIFLNFVGKIARDTLRTDIKKPTQQTHEVIATQQFDAEALPGSVNVDATSYKGKVRRNADSTVSFTSMTPYGPIIERGIVDSVSGRHINIISETRTTAGMRDTPTVITSRMDDGTLAEVKRAASVLSLLRGTGAKDVSPFIQNIWLSGKMEWPDLWTKRQVAEQNTSLLFSQLLLPLAPLNPSQQAAVDAMLNPAEPITIIRGPPGTGKTSVIARFVLTALSCGESGIWLVAQSNVAVKNIAEKLQSVGFTDWKILVSKDFSHDWHDHLYLKVQDNIIHSDQFFKYPFRHLRSCKFTHHVSMQHLIIDEASQIDVGDYLSPILSFQRSLQEITFIGDDKQLPPFGAEELLDLQSIFEVSHLQDTIKLLNIQYRMPPQIGKFISDSIYEGLLDSNPKHPIQLPQLSCYFIHVDGTEKGMISGSYENPSECSTVIQLAQIMQNKELKYKIITPYDGQRNLIEKTMKITEGLDWEEKCFNVDSFQGNEEDFIIISIVRTRALGFLSNLRRTNVMLTRCKRGMIIVSNSMFLKGKGASCLVGELQKYLHDNAWISMEKFEANSFIN